MRWVRILPMVAAGVVAGCTGGGDGKSSNQPPLGLDDTYGADEDAALTVPALSGVLANDEDPDGDALTAAVETPPANGTLALSADGGFAYSPDENFSGSDSFSYRVSDGTAFTVATVALTVAAVNDAPVAAAESLTVAEDSVLSIGAQDGVLANDADADGDALTASVVSGPASGALTLGADGSVEYVPDADYNGSDSFTYLASDDALDSELTTVTITVTAVNDAPTAMDDAGMVAEDGVLSVPAPGVLVNDTDVDGDPLEAVLEAGPASGQVTLDPDGAYEYTPDADFAGADSFTYRAFDAMLGSGVVTVAITVTAVNDAPVGMADAYTVAEDGLLSEPAATGVLANDVDADGDTLTATLVSSTLNGSLSLGTDGSFTYQPDPDFNGADSFTYRAGDGNLQSAITTVTLDVTAVNDAPIATADAGTVAEDATLAVSAPGVLMNDSDVDADALEAVIEDSPVNGALLLSADGSFTYDPDPDFSGTDSFTYRADDGVATSDAVTVTITVTPEPDAPTAVPDSFSVAEDELLVVAASGVLANDSDADGDALAAVLETAASNGTLDLETDGSFTYLPDANFHGEDTFTYRAHDGALPSAIVTVTLTVTPVNDAPAAEDDTYTIAEDASLVRDAAAGILANDLDVDGDLLRAALQDSPANGALALGTDGSFTYTPFADFFGDDSFTYRATDGTLFSSVRTVLIQVTPVNDAPVAVADAFDTAENQTLVAVVPGVLANDTDGDGGGPITAVLTSGAAFGVVTLDADGSFTYEPDPGFSGTDSFTYRASDGTDLSGPATVTITVLPGPGLAFTAVRYAATDRSENIAAGDFNGDGWMDLIATGFFSDRVLLFMNDGDGTFTSTFFFCLGDIPHGVAVADFNGDGDLDFAYAVFNGGTQSSVATYLGNGDGTFDAGTLRPADDGPTDVAVGDFDGDGFLDLAVANQTTNNVSLLRGNGDGSFVAATHIATGCSTLTSVAAAFIDGGTTLDLVVTGFSGQVGILLGDGAGAFTPTCTNVSAHVTETMDAAIGDLDADGDLDIATIARGNSRVAIMKGDGTGAFTTTSFGMPFGAASNLEGVALADLDKDGDLEVIVSGSFSSTLTILWGNPTGSFNGGGGSTHAAQLPYEIIAVDLNGDTHPDIAASSRSGTYGISVLLN